jgi:hypothetical protein
MKTDKENITRHDYERNHGYVVRYMRDGALFQKMFSDVRYGSPENALEAAELYLSELKAAFPPMNRREYAQILRRKKEGIAGLNGVLKKAKLQRNLFPLTSMEKNAQSNLPSKPGKPACVK